MIYEPVVRGPGGSEVWWRHKTGVKTDVGIKTKVLGIFWKFFLRLSSVHLNIGFLWKNYWNSKIRDLEIFSSFLTSRSRHCDAYRGLRQIHTGLRQPDLRRKCNFFPVFSNFKSKHGNNLVEVSGDLEKLQNSVDMLE